MIRSSVIFLATSCVLALSFQLNAQQQGSFKGSLEFGPLLGPNIGFQISLEPKYNITDRSNVGLRIELPGFFGRDVNLNNNYLVFDDEESNTQGLFLPVTYEYYWGKRGRSFQPYIGGGLGYFRMFGDIAVFDPEDIENVVSSFSRGTIAAIAKVGFEWGKFRYGFAFTYVPDTKLITESGEVLGRTRDYYVHFNIGFTLFGGKWRKAQ